MVAPSCYTMRSAGLSINAAAVFLRGAAAVVGPRPTSAPLSRATAAGCVLCRLMSTTGSLSADFRWEDLTTPVNFLCCDHNGDFVFEQPLSRIGSTVRDRTRGNCAHASPCNGKHGLSLCEYY